MSSSEIYDVPPEILTLILDYGGHFSLHQKGLPFVVRASHVSQRWRSIALGTPSVWSGIPIHPLRPSLTEHYLKRSANSLLDVYFHFHNESQAMDTLKLTSKYRSRWRNLYLEVGTGRAVFIVMAFLKAVGPTSMPLLQHLEFNFTDRFITMGGLPEVFISPPPKLHSLTMHRVSFLFQSPIFRNATQLDLSLLPPSMRNPSYTNFGRLMNSLKNLTRLKLTGVFPQLIDGTDYDDINLPYLHTLELVMDKEKDYVPLFFSVIYAPALRTLRFESGSNPTWDGFLSCVDVVSSKFGCLQDLLLILSSLTVPDSITLYPNLFLGFSELRILSVTAVHDELMRRFLTRPLLFIYDAAGTYLPDDYDMMKEHEFADAAIWPKLELLVVRAPLSPTFGDEGETKCKVYTDLEVLRVLRSSIGLPLDIYPCPLSANHNLDPLDVE